jgi:ATP-dependent RNA helicase DDX18/HAS1
MVFFSSCNSVKYHAELLNYIDVPVLDIHGQQKQSKRTTTFFEFCNAKSGTLLCTDVAARGLDIPYVDWIIQFDPPDEPKEYIHRVGRTARGAEGKGRALLFLTPQELGFLRYLRAAKVALNEYEFPTDKVANVQAQLEKLVERNYFLHRSAKDAYRSYLQSYASHSLKHIFDVGQLDLEAVGRSFGFSVPPRVNLIMAMAGPKSRRRPLPPGGGAGDAKTKSAIIRAQKSGHAFSAANPHGRRPMGDTRQFSH